MAYKNNKKLSQHDRDVLRSFAHRQVEATQDQSALDAAYDAAATVVHNEMIKQWPKKDMVVLAKYDFANADECIHIAGCQHYEFGQFCFREGDKRIVMRPNGSCGRSRGRNPIMLDEAAQPVYATFVKEKEAYDAAIKQRLNDFYALIDNTVTFNQIADVWPAAEKLRPEIVGSAMALSVLSNDVVDRLKHDPAMELQEE